MMQRCESMNRKLMGWIQIWGGILAFLFSGGIGFNGMLGMMSGSYSMMDYGSGFAVSILALVFIISGIYKTIDKKSKR